MYKTLYRTYRPSNFQEVVGQEIIIKSLLNAIETGKITHSYLFSGKSGTGKTTIAKILAKAINCLDENVKPCNKCKTCSSINENTTMDVIEMDAASNNGVDQVRNIINSIQYPPIVCKYKVYIIDEVHMLTTAAFNALLKTLEEPPTNSIFILATTEQHKIPETILTRCQRYNLKKVSATDTTKLLSKIMKKEEKDYDEKALKTISDMSNGSVRKALSILEQCIHLNSKLTIDMINQVHNLIPSKDLTELISLTYNSEIQPVYQKLELINENSTNYHIVLEDILLFLKDVLIQEYIKNDNSKYISVIKEQNINYDEKFIFGAIEIIKNTLEKIKYSSNPKLQFEICILELTKINKNGLNKKIVVEKPIIEKPIIEKPKIETIKNNKVLTEKQDIQIKPYNNPEETIKLEEEIKLTKQDEDKLLKEIVEEQKQIEQTHINNEVIETEQQTHKLLNILLTAIKSQREFVNEKVNGLKQIERNQENSKWISLFSSSKIAAASNDAIIILYEYEASAHVLNSHFKDNNFLKFIKEIFGREYLLVGTWKEEWDEEVELYKNLKKDNKLPIAKKVVVPRYVEKQIIDKTEIQKAQDLFGDVLEVEDWK